MVTLLKTVVRAHVGPLPRQTGRVYAHDIELDGDENLTLGQRVEILDEASRTPPPGSRRSSKPPRTTGTSSRSSRERISPPSRFMIIGYPKGITDAGSCP